MASQSLVTAKYIPAETILGIGLIAILQPGTGLPGSMLSKNARSLSPVLHRSRHAADPRHAGMKEAMRIIDDRIIAPEFGGRLTQAAAREPTHGT
jgi:hypothetical protein